jgi:hypothetical protein
VGKPRFLPKEPDKGFDVTTNWQMVPRGGARGLNLYDGADLTLRMKWDKLIFNEVKLSGTDRREVWVSGQKPGLGFSKLLARTFGPRRRLRLMEDIPESCHMCCNVIAPAPVQWSTRQASNDLAGVFTMSVDTC